MRIKLISYAILISVILAFQAGCQQVSPVAPGAMAQKWQPQLPSLDLTLGWNGRHFQVPAPVIIPPELIASGYAKWNGSFWAVRLSDGRIAKMLSVRVVGSDDLVAPVVEIYRPDGTLQVRQFNGPGATPGPNQPFQWDIYEADGKMLQTHVACQFDARTGERSVHMVEMYKNGAIAGRYFVHDGVVTVETDGDTARMHFIHETTRPAS